MKASIIEKKAATQKKAMNLKMKITIDSGRNDRDMPIDRSKTRFRSMMSKYDGRKLIP